MVDSPLINVTTYDLFLLRYRSFARVASGVPPPLRTRPIFFEARHAMMHVLCGFAVMYVSKLIRAFPWPAPWLEQKPLNCSVCMNGWVAIAGGVVDLLVEGGARLSLSSIGSIALTWASAAGIALLADACVDWLSGRNWGRPPL